MTVHVYSVHDTVPCCQLILNLSLYIQLSVGLGLSSASFSMYITTNNGKLRHSGCLELPPCKPMSASTSGANVQGMYCDLIRVLLAIGSTEVHIVHLRSPLPKHDSGTAHSGANKHLRYYYTLLLT